MGHFLFLICISQVNRTKQQGSKWLDLSEQEGRTAGNEVGEVALSDQAGFAEKSKNMELGFLELLAEP